MINILIKKFREKINTDKWSLFILTFLFHEIFVLLLNSNLLDLVSDVSDNITYFNHASLISDLLHSGSYVLGMVYNSHWYPLFVGILFSTFGKSMILGASFNALLVALSSVILYELITLFDKKSSRKVIFWITFLLVNGYLSLMLYSSLLLKEAWIVFLMLGIIYLALHLLNQEKFNWLYFFSILFFFVAMHSLKFFVGYAVISGFLVAWFLNGKFPIKKRVLYGSTMIFLVVSTIFCLTYSKSIVNFTGPKITNVVQPKFIYNTRVDYYKGGATTTNIQVVEKKEDGSPQKNTNNYSFSLSGIAKSFLNTMLGPFPWQISLHKYILISFDLLFWYLILFLGCIGILKSNLRSSIFYLIPIGVIIVSLIMGVDNAGALIRYRIPLLILFSIFVSSGVSYLIGRKKNYENTLHNH